MQRVFGQSMSFVLLLFLACFIQFIFVDTCLAKSHISKKHITSSRIKGVRAAKKPKIKNQDEVTSEFSNEIPTALGPLGTTPAAPNFDVKSYILIDANTGDVLAEKNASLHIVPASLTKLMTLYLVESHLQSGKIHLTDLVPVSEKAWRTEGSRMFIKVGTTVPIGELIKGIVIVSGNDATVAVAEYMAGSEEAFIALMNQAARDLKMDNTSYADVSGLPDPNNYSTAYDLAILARALIIKFPEYYPWFKEKWYSYNDIKQPNRNRLLWRDSSVDGIKTGRTDEAGYCLIASALRNDMRLIAVVIGAKNDTARTNYTQALLNYGYRFFETKKLFDVGATLVTANVLFGKINTINLGLKENLYITMPTGEVQALKAKAVVAERLKAPIAKGQECGTLNILSGEKVVASRPLVALSDDPRGSIFTVIWDYIVSLVKR